MANLKRKPAASPAADSVPPYSLFCWLALAWAIFVFVAHLRIFSQKIPISFGVYCDQLPAQFAPGPNLANFWLGHSLRTIGVFLFFAGADAVGQILLQRFLPSSEDDVFARLRLPLSLGLGLGVLGYVAFGLFASGFAHRGVFIGLNVILCLLGIGRFIPALCDSPDSSARAAHYAPPDAIQKIVAAFIFVALAFSFLGTTQPEISYDALVYHLAVPQTYLFAGRMIEMPYNHYSYLPLFTSMLYSWGLAIDGMYSAKLISFGIGFCVLIGLYRCGLVLKDRLLGLIACAVFIGTPLVIYLFWTTNSDSGATFFLLLTLISVWSGLKDFEKNGRLIYLAGIFGGLALSSKYTSAFGIIILTLYLAERCWKAGQTRKFFIYCVLLSLPLIPWLARNCSYTGNPVYPYLAGTLGPKTTDFELMRGWQNEVRDASPGFRPVLHVKKLWEDAVLGFTNAAFNFIGPLFVGFLPFIFLVSNIAWVRLGTVFVFGALLLGLSSTYITRLMLPYFAPLALILGCATSAMLSRSAQKNWTLALLISILSFNIYLLSIMIFLTSTDGLSVAAGRVAPSEFLMQSRNYYPDPTYGAYEAARRLNLQTQDRILVIGESRAFYSPSLAIASAPHDVSAILRWADRSKTPEELLSKLSAERIAVVILNRSELARTNAAGNIDGRTLSTISYVMDHYFEEVYRDRWTVVVRRKV